MVSVDNFSVSYDGKCEGSGSAEVQVTLNKHTPTPIKISGEGKSMVLKLRWDFPYYLRAGRMKTLLGEKKRNLDVYGRTDAHIKNKIIKIFCEQVKKAVQEYGDWPSATGLPDSSLSHSRAHALNTYASGLYTK